MKLKCIAAALSLFGLLSVIAGQSYHIRTKHRTNLRASGSLAARIVDTARPGTTLQVIGSLNSWLRINRNGKEVWMAEWVDHSRIDGSVQTQSSIDNCCFVDRQCSSDHDWTAGYWAFQNNQCSTAAASQPPKSNTGATSAAPEVNNCCFLGWQCSSDQQWDRGYHAYQNNQCDYPVAIEGSEAFIVQVQKALDMLKKWAPEWYAYATSGLSRIREVPDEQGSGAWLDERRFDIATRHAFSRAGAGGVIWLAGIIVHDACHVHRDEAGLQSGGRDGELACLQAQLPALEAIDPRDRYSAWINTLIANIDNIEYQWWH